MARHAAGKWPPHWRKRAGNAILGAPRRKAPACRPPGRTAHETLLFADLALCPNRARRRPGKGRGRTHRADRRPRRGQRHRGQEPAQQGAHLDHRRRRNPDRIEADLPLPGFPWRGAGTLSPGGLGPAPGAAVRGLDPRRARRHRAPAHGDPARRRHPIGLVGPTPEAQDRPRPRPARGGHRGRHRGADHRPPLPSAARFPSSTASWPIPIGAPITPASKPGTKLTKTPPPWPPPRPETEHGPSISAAPQKVPRHAAAQQGACAGGPNPLQWRHLGGIGRIAAGREHKAEP